MPILGDFAESVLISLKLDHSGISNTSIVILILKDFQEEELYEDMLQIRVDLNTSKEFNEEQASKWTTAKEDSHVTIVS